MALAQTVCTENTNRSNVQILSTFLMTYPPLRNCTGSSPSKLNTLKTNDLQATPQGMLQLFCQEWKTLALRGRFPSQSKRMKGRYSPDHRPKRLLSRRKFRLLVWKL